MMNKPLVRCLIASFLGVLFLIVVIFKNVISVDRAIARELALPRPTALLQLGDAYSPTLLKGIEVDPDNLKKLEFIISKGDSNKLDDLETDRLLEYFFAALTLPMEQVWVNLSPYEKDRIIPKTLAQTALGRDLLAQDYILKQLSSSLTHPESDIGQLFWAETSEDKKDEQSFNKVWITPNKAVVYENDNIALIDQSTLKLQSEQDYLATQLNAASTTSASRAQTVLLEELSSQVNNSKYFVKLRQIYSAIILAQWFKKNYAQTLYKSYLNQNQITVIELESLSYKDVVYDFYCRSFENGVYSYIEKVDDKQRHYASGGFSSSIVNTIIEFVREPTVQIKSKIHPGDYSLKVIVDEIQVPETDDALSKNSSAVKNDLVDDMQQLIDSFQKERPEIKIELKLDGYKPLYDHRKRIKFILSELIRNSIQGRYIDSPFYKSAVKQVAVNLRLESDLLAIQVVDQGRGLREDIYAQFIEWQKNKTPNTVISLKGKSQINSGKGLQVAQRYIEAMGGNFFIDNRPYEQYGENSGLKAMIVVPTKQLAQNTGGIDFGSFESQGQELEDENKLLALEYHLISKTQYID